MGAAYLPPPSEPDVPTSGHSGGLAHLYERAVALHGRGDLNGARALYEQILRTDPRHAKALHMLGTAALQCGDLQNGVALVRQSLEIDPTQPAAYSALGNALRSLGRPHEALQMFDRALELDPNHLPAHNNRGSALVDVGRLEEAIESYERVLHLAPDHFGALVNCGYAVLRAKQPGRALANFQRALRLRPDSTRALFGYADALRFLRQFKEALAILERGLALEPGNAQGWHDHGCVLHELRRVEEAVPSYERAVGLNSQDATYHCYLGSALLELGRFEAAAASFARGVEIAPDFPYAIGSILEARMAQCDWMQWHQDVERVLAAVNQGKPAIFPIALLVATDLPAAHLELAKAYVRMHPPVPRAEIKRYAHPRLRVAYLSADFREHPVSQLLAGVLESHDRERFEVSAIALRALDSSALGQRIRAASDRFLDVSRVSDEVVADTLRQMEVDIAVDLHGITQGMRADILARRAAPVQVSYLGFPATMGASYIDYIIGDRIVIPEGAEDAYTEHIVRLPYSFLPFDDRRTIPEHTPTREEAGLPPTGFVFCDLNNHLKLTPVMFDVWMRILRETPGSCLWLRWARAPVIANLRREAMARGVAAERIVFASKVPTLEEHLARQRLADLFLDTLPYNAHATAAQALWAGVPVLTCQGTAFAGRVASSLLHAVGLPELISRNLQEYEHLALQLARDPERLAALRERLARQRATSPLFDTKGYCRQLEAAFVLMSERQRRGEAPTHLNMTAA
jgi:predicted O-linked N-acetylglucosamine transferase (SPINDLY family)